MDIREALAGELRAERGRQNVTIQEWADRAGLSWRALQRYLTGERQPRLEDLDSLAKVFGLRASTFLARAESAPTPTGRDIGDADRAEVMGVINEVTAKGERDDPSRAGDQGA